MHFLPDCVLEGNGLRVISFHSTIFQSYGDFTVTGEGLQFFTEYLTLMTIEQWGILSVPHTYCDT